MSGVTYGINRERPPKVWWSDVLGLIWSDNGGRSYWRVEGGRAVEFFHLPRHADPLGDGAPSDPVCYCEL